MHYQSYLHVLPELPNLPKKILSQHPVYHNNHGTDKLEPSAEEEEVRTVEQHDHQSQGVFHLN